LLVGIHSLSSGSIFEKLALAVAAEEVPEVVVMVVGDEDVASALLEMVGGVA